MDMDVKLVEFGSKQISEVYNPGINVGIQTRCVCIFSTLLALDSEMFLFPDS